MATQEELRLRYKAVVGRAAYRREAMMRALTRYSFRAAIYGILAVGMVLILLPFFWMVSTSLKSEADVFAYPVKWIPNPIRWQNYPEAWTIRPFTTFFKNSVIIALSCCFGTVLSSSLVAFSFARLRWPGRDWLFLLVLATMMVPHHVTMVPTFILFRKLNWVNTFKPLILPFFAGIPFHIFLLRQFFMTIPLELDDAAKIDGCGFFDIYWRILLPLCKPALGIVAVFAIQGRWNDFMGPLIYLNSMHKYTLAMGLHFFKGEFGTDWHWLMACSLVSMMPIVTLFFFAQRYFIQGVVFTGLKG